MSEERSEGVLGKKVRTIALGGKAAGVLSIFLLVPFVRRLRARRHEQHHRRWLLGH